MSVFFLHSQTQEFSISPQLHTQGSGCIASETIWGQVKLFLLPAPAYLRRDVLWLSFSGQPASRQKWLGRKVRWRKVAVWRPGSRVKGQARRATFLFWLHSLWSATTCQATSSNSRSAMNTSCTNSLANRVLTWSDHLPNTWGFGDTLDLIQNNSYG